MGSGVVYSDAMSPLSPNSLTDAHLPGESVEASSLATTALQPLKGAAFWAAIALPFLHLPLLVTGLESRTTLLAFVALVALNVVALFVGHPHRAADGT